MGREYQIGDQFVIETGMRQYQSGLAFLLESVVLTMPTLEVTGTADDGTYAFGSVAVDTPTSHQFTIENIGDGSDTLGTLSISGTGWSIDAVDNPSGDALAASGTTTVTVIGNFATTGAKTGILTIPSNDAASPYVINLTAMTVAAASASSGFSILGSIKPTNILGM